MNCPEITNGNIYQGDSLDLLKCVKSKSVDLIITSPPYSNIRKNHYSGVKSDNYVKWFSPIGKQLYRVTKDTGSFVLNIKENVQNGERHEYVHDLIKDLKKIGWKWNETYIWMKPNPFPVGPVRRPKDAFEYLHHFVKSPVFKFNLNREIMPSESKTCKKINAVSYVDKTKFNTHQRNKARMLKNCGMTLPSNILVMSNTSINKSHPAQFPEKLPAFFINVMTDPGDMVLDPFAGSGTTNVMAKKACRKTIGFDLKQEYVLQSNKNLQLVRCESS